MILLLDIGNSRIKSAHWQDGTLVQQWVCENDQPLESNLQGIHTLDRVIACNVAAPAIAQRVTDWCADKGSTIEWITSTHPIEGLKHSYAQPTTFGDDRWLAMAGARRACNGCLCVVDCGTATTVDVIDKKGQHRGGAIFPGVATMRVALNRQTHYLSDVDVTVEAFSSTTEKAIAGGTVYALCGAIERLLTEAGKEIDPDLTCIITGGEATLIQPILQHQFSLDTTLVLKGLAVAAGLQ
jgi:type III pantothenate kinase